MQHFRELDASAASTSQQREALHKNLREILAEIRALAVLSAEYSSAILLVYSKREEVEATQAWLEGIALSLWNRAVLYGCTESDSDMHKYCASRKGFPGPNLLFRIDECSNGKGMQCVTEPFSASRWRSTGRASPLCRPTWPGLPRVPPAPSSGAADAKSSYF
jgi:hypothetical protein